MWRQKKLIEFRRNPVMLKGALEFYRDHPVEFIEHFLSTYDPRLAGSERPTTMPFILFPRQREFIHWLHQLVLIQNNGLNEKARDMGATWCASAFSVWLWLFMPGSSVGWGSRKEQLVDKLGDADSIFEKMRIMIRSMPREFWPVGFDATDHMPFMRILNPETGSTITGEAGDNIGRGGRKLIYFKDEAAHYERPEKIEAALSDTTRVQVDISSVNGNGNVFYNKRKAGKEWNPFYPMDPSKTSVFIFDWRHHPEKTQEWYNKRKAKFENEGLSHIFAQEVDRNYSASVTGIIIRAEWVQAAIDAHVRLGFDDEGIYVAGLDVADEGGDKNALSIRKGPILRYCEAWGEGDTGKTARRAVMTIRDMGALPIPLQYDSVGVGAGIKAETNRLADDGLMPDGLSMVPWSAGAGVLFPDRNLIRGDKGTPINKDLFSGLKAQAWYEVARRFERTYKAVTEGAEFDPGELISIPSTLANRHQLEAELSQAVWKDATSTLKMTVDKAPSGTKSPNLADSLVMAYFPVKTNIGLYTLGNVG